RNSMTYRGAMLSIKKVPSPSLFLPGHLPQLHDYYRPGKK
ncbi:unnamed protein product, partial [Timema podura]|nr:unnamed protein product [Timema podura]